MLESSVSKKFAIIVAGGSGARMHTDIPKQFLLLCRKPVLMHVIEAFYNCDTKPVLIVALSAAWQAHWEGLCRQYDFHVPHQVCSGGNTRFHSVKTALSFIPDDVNAIVAVHDGARPLVTKELIDYSFAVTGKTGNAVAAVKSQDSVRLVTGAASEHIPRDTVMLVQTPQTFNAGRLKKAYEMDYAESFTDDASVYEAAGGKINIIPGEYTNIKITHPQDISFAEIIKKAAYI